MKLASVLLRDKLPTLSANHLTAETTGFEMTVEGGFVTIKRPQYPDEEPFIVPMSNVVAMRKLPAVTEKPKRKTPAGESIPEPISVLVPPEKK